MISAFANPSVCVVDDELEDYRPLLRALNELFVACVHFEGSDTSKLPPDPFNSLRLIFMDLHLNGAGGKTPASHAANIFKRLVSTETAPVVVVIWSKYADESTNDPGQPIDDQPSDADAFKLAVLEAESRFAGRLIFVQMPKPKPKQGRPIEEKWIDDLKTNIENVIKGQNGVKALWAWESLVGQSCLSVSSLLTDLTIDPTASPDGSAVDACLQAMLQKLCSKQSEGDLHEQTAARHLTSVLGQILVDELEHHTPNPLSNHSSWLAALVADKLPSGLAPKVNSLLLTANFSSSPIAFLPGLVYKIVDEMAFQSLMGCGFVDLKEACFDGKTTTDKWSDWDSRVEPCLIELSSSCDVTQKKRKTASLVAGLMVPSDLCKFAKDKDAYSKTASVTRKFSAAGTDGVEKTVVFVFCAHYKLTLPVDIPQTWLEPEFRMRELQTTMLRNWLTGHAARVGLVTL